MRFVRTRKVLIVLFDDVQSLDVTGPLEVFAGANTYLAAHARSDADAADETGYEIRTASVGGRPVRTSSGLRLSPDADLADESAPHTVVVPGGHGSRTGQPAIVDWLRANSRRSRRTVSVCTGAFLLAAAGLLDGRRATTHWAYAADLAAEYPEVDVDPEPIYLRDGRIVTSAGVTAGIDLALALVEDDHGRDAALTVARHLVMFLRRPGNQTQFSAQLRAQTATSRPVRELQHFITAHPAADLSVAALAGRANLSPRQFARVFLAETGTPPGRYVDDVRLEAARRHLEDGTHPVELVARSCGYGTPEAMRRAFLRTLGVSPAEYRRRFTPHTHAS